MATGQTPGVAARPSVWRLLRIPSLRSATASDWAQLVRFCLVGASGYVVNLVVFALLLNVGGLHHVLAAVGAFCVAWVNNFVLNRHWTFHRDQSSALRQGARYFAVSLVSLVINVVLLELLVRAGMPELPAQAIAILLVTPVAFLLNRRWAFR